jgi:hypothetical protein
MAQYTIIGIVKAEPLIDERVDYEDGAIMEITVWRVPQPVPPSTHGLKYSLFYGRSGEREVGYDDERGKGDHRHFKTTATSRIVRRNTGSRRSNG